MLKNYVKRSIMLLGAAAVVATAGAAGWRDVTGKYITNPAYLAGWQGALTDVANGVGEVYNGAFNLYQTLPDMPAGKYVLTVNAHYRCSTNEYSKANMANGEKHWAYIYVNDKQTPVKGLFDEGETAPNSTGEANEAYQAGKFLNTVEYDHAGGDLVVGICNTGGYNDEWTCFDNFMLTCDGVDCTDKIVNNDFSSGIEKVKDESLAGWNAVNAGGDTKVPDHNCGGGVYRKVNASAYNYAQNPELPAGKYRFGLLTFHRYGGDGNDPERGISCKGAWGYVDNKGVSVPSARKHYDANDYETLTDYPHAYVFAHFGETKLFNNTTVDEFGGDYDPAKDALTRIKCCWELNNGDVYAMPHNEPWQSADGVTPDEVPAETRNAVYSWCDSGCEREAAGAFVNEPEKYRHWAEFTVAETSKVWVGFFKHSKSSDQYWHPWCDIRLEVWDENYTPAGVEGIANDVIDANAPVEYYNLQGVRVAEPTTGLYIVKQGSKVSKKLIRK